MEDSILYESLNYSDNVTDLSFEYDGEELIITTKNGDYVELDYFEIDALNRFIERFKAFKREMRES